MLACLPAVLVCFVGGIRVRVACCISGLSLFQLLFSAHFRFRFVLCSVCLAAFLIVFVVALSCPNLFCRVMIGFVLGNFVLRASFLQPFPSVSFVSSPGFDCC